MKHKLLLFLTILSITGCSLQELRHEDRPTTSRAFGVEEAKEFFEKDHMGLLTRSHAGETTGKKFVGKLHPGDFTPLWDKAAYSESDGVAAYDVDILADRSIIAIRSKFGPSGAKAERLKVYQKLVVRRNVQSGKMASYVLSLIPDVGCDDRRLPDRFSSRGKDKGGFSGIAVYTTTDRGALVRVQEYKNGVLQRGVYIPSGEGSYLDRCSKAREILNGVALMSRKNIMTRSGEDVWEDSWDDNDYSNLDINDLEDLGEGVYTDGNGHYYIDIDYDGDIDLETIAPGHVEDEEQEEPEEPEEPETPMPETGTGDEGDGNDGSESGGDIELGYGPQENAGSIDDETSNSIDPVIFATTINDMKEKLADQLGTTRFRSFFRLENPVSGTLASMSLIDEMCFYDCSQNILIKVSPSLDEVQLPLVLAHEFMHLILIEISRKAGSEDMLKIVNRELWDAIEKYDDLPELSNKTVNKYNFGHHEYMGAHVDEIENILRECRPGQDEKFYEYGKWGGGLQHTEAFKELSKSEQRHINNYLRREHLN